MRVIDLFSGAGGMSLGFADPRFCGGFQPILALDSDPAAVKTHELNFSGRSICANIEQWLEREKVPTADVVIGGPPCQGFSLLNKKRDGDARRALWEPFIEIADRAGARVFVMENVAELYRSPERGLIEAKAEQHGFRTQACILNAADYGAPQTRKRTIILGWRNVSDLPYFPPLPSHAQPCKQTISRAGGRFGTLSLTCRSLQARRSGRERRSIFISGGLPSPQVSRDMKQYLSEEIASTFSATGRT